MTVFYLIRHGQSEGNLRTEFIGQGDAPLTALGELQARKTGEYLSDVSFDYAYASDLIRAYRTGEIALAGRDIRLVPDAELREIFAGDWEGKTFSSLEQEYPTSYDVWKKDIGKARPSSGESVIQLYRRVNKRIEELALLHPNSTVLIATHATPIRCITARASAISEQDVHKIAWAPNSSVTVIGVENGVFSVIKPATAHYLGDIATFLPKNV